MKRVFACSPCSTLVQYPRGQGLAKITGAGAASLARRTQGPDGPSPPLPPPPVFGDALIHSLPRCRYSHRERVVRRVRLALTRLTLSSRIDDIAIWCAAAYELKRYGDDAIGFAARRAERLSGLGDTEGSLAWTRILRALEVLRRETRGEDESGKGPFARTLTPAFPES